jgi:hypothetical protein
MLLGMAVRMGLDLNLYRKNEHGKVYSDEDRTRAYEVGDTANVAVSSSPFHRSKIEKERGSLRLHWTSPGAHR